MFGKKQNQGQGKGYTWVSFRLDTGEWRATITSSAGYQTSCKGPNDRKALENAIEKYNLGVRNAKIANAR